MKPRIMAAGLVLLVSVCCIAGEQPHSTIQGRIADSEGAAIKNARLLAHWDSSGSTVGLTDNIGIREDLTVMTDANGDYSLSVPPGFYDLFITSMSFTPVAAKVRVKEGQRATFNARLAPNPLVCKELCDQITQPAQ